MAVNSVGSNEVDRFQARIGDFEQLQQQRQMRMGKGPGNHDKAEMSKIGQFFSSIHNAFNPEENPEIKDFFSQVRDAAVSGNLNAEKLAEEAPDSLKAFVEENGIDLVDILSTIGKHPPKGKGPGKFVNGENAQFFAQLRNGLSGDDKTAVRDFFSQVRDSVKSGDYDLNSLIAQAPEALLSLADSENIDLNELLTTMSTRITARQED